MSTAINQKEYVKKYLSGPSKDKKKKTKKKHFKGQGLKIIDNDLDLSKLRPLDGDELDIFGGDEDAPQIAGIIDERPEEIKKIEQYNTSTKWRVISQDDGFNSKLQIEELKKDRKEQAKENELVFGKMYSDSEDEKEQNDSQGKSKRDDDSDTSPPRKRSDNKQEKSGRRDSSDPSPPRKNERKDSRHQRSKRDSDSDASPPRRNERKDLNQKSKRHNESDESPPRRKDSKQKSKRDNDSDASPPRRNEKRENARKERSKRDNDSDASPPRKKHNKSQDRKNYDSDLSPPRKSETKPKERRKPSRWGDIDQSEDRRNKDGGHSKRGARSVSSDLSPPRKNRHKDGSKRKEDSDESPPRKKIISSQRKGDKSGDKRRYDSDESPPRKSKRDSDSPPPSNKKMARTLEGKLAGLQDAAHLRSENEAFRKREEEAFKRMTDEVSGRNASVNRRAGKRETSEERRKQIEKAEKQKELDEKYKRWNKGVKQVEAIEARRLDFAHEASKPVARYKGDRDLEDSLRNVEREFDPMAAFNKEKNKSGMSEKVYKGRFPPNRFNIRPGYRWDGVDRSNGYEKKYFETQSKRKAEEDEYYKWSSADL